MAHLGFVPTSAISRGGARGVSSNYNNPTVGGAGFTRYGSASPQAPANVSRQQPFSVTPLQTRRGRAIDVTFNRPAGFQLEPRGSYLPGLPMPNSLNKTVHQTTKELNAQWLEEEELMASAGSRPDIDMKLNQEAEPATQPHQYSAEGLHSQQSANPVQSADEAEKPAVLSNSRAPSFYPMTGLNKAPNPPSNVGGEASTNYLPTLQGQPLSATPQTSRRSVGLLKNDAYQYNDLEKPVNTSGNQLSAEHSECAAGSKPNFTTAAEAKLNFQTAVTAAATRHVEESLADTATLKSGPAKNDVHLTTEEAAEIRAIFQKFFEVGEKINRVFSKMI